MCSESEPGRKESGRKGLRGSENTPSAPVKMKVKTHTRGLFMYFEIKH